MKKVLLSAAAFLFVVTAFSQQDSIKTVPAAIEVKAKKKKEFDLSNRSGDHFLIQLGYAGWNNTPDTINTGGLPRSANIYFMLDFPFKNNPRLSAAIGAGIGTDHIFFKKTYVGIKDATDEIRFQNLADTNHFKKYKLATTWLEAPIELRYTSRPDKPGKSFKAAIGVKVGTLLKAGTKGKTWQNKAGNTITAYTEKISSKRFFNTLRVVPTVRVGYGHVTLYAAYQVGTLFKEGLGPDVRPYSIGLTLSGL